MEIPMLEPIKREQKVVKEVIIGLAQEKCIQENGSEIYHTAKANT